MPFEPARMVAVILSKREGNMGRSPNALWTSPRIRGFCGGAGSRDAEGLVGAPRDLGRAWLGGASEGWLGIDDPHSDPPQGSGDAGELEGGQFGVGPQGRRRKKERSRAGRPAKAAAEASGRGTPGGEAARGEHPHRGRKKPWATRATQPRWAPRLGWGRGLSGRGTGRPERKQWDMRMMAGGSGTRYGVRRGRNDLGTRGPGGRGRLGPKRYPAQAGSGTRRA